MASCAEGSLLPRLHRQGQLWAIQYGLLVVVILCASLVYSKEQHSVTAVQGLLKRSFPQIARHFVLDVRVTCQSPHRQCFRAASDGTSVLVQATSGTELAAGINFWLKERCGSSVSWQSTGGHQLDMSCFTSDSLQDLKYKTPLYRGRSAEFFYYQNVVTASYSSTWWSWEKWQEEIDWMALQGINLPLAFTGQEHIWRRVFAKWNLTESYLEHHFAGPSFLAWQRMGNLMGWGGPLPLNWIKSQAVLQKRVLERMRSLGMTPVLPAFAGFVPAAFQQMYPHANVSRLSNWGNFSDQYCCAHLLDPLDPLFVQIGSDFVTELRAEFGHDQVGWYSCDTFNEMLPPSNDPAYLATASAAVYQGMAAADPGSRWLMQAWLFYDRADFWQAPQVQGLLSGVPQGALVLVDLYAEVYPQWKRLQGFFGVPWLWCMLHNFGGNIGMYGDLAAIAQGPEEALSTSSSLIGWGMCPEGTQQNPVVYAAMSEWAFRAQALDLKAWVPAYARQRYGPATPPAALQAWQLLAATVYNAQDGHINHATDIPQSRPGLAFPEGGLYGLRPHLWYNPAQVVQAWCLLLSCAQQLQGLDTFRYDLVDVGRQVLSKHATQLWQQAVQAYKGGMARELRDAGSQLLSLLTNMDALLASHSGFLLGPWLEDAKSAATTEEEAARFEWNMRTQISIWGTSQDGGSEIEDYANRQWGGLMHSYHRRRWELWLKHLQDDLQLLRPYDATAWRMKSISFTHAWTRERSSFALKPKGDAVALSQMLFHCYVNESPLSWSSEPTEADSTSSAGRNNGILQPDGHFGPN